MVVGRPRRLGRDRFPGHAGRRVGYPVGHADGARWFDRRAAAAEAKMQLGTASVDTQMQEIEREALDMQLQDKLLAYKRDMGLLGTGSAAPTPQALPAEGETSPAGGNNGTGSS